MEKTVMTQIPNMYYDRARHDLLKLLPRAHFIETALDVGCGDGATGEILKIKYGVKVVVGIEANKEHAKKAETKIDKVIANNAEDAHALPFHSNQFDLIVMADILEHFVDPWNTLARYRDFLKPNGVLLASIPNIQHWRTVMNLLRGEWQYTNWGTLDRTHLRFFTKSSIKDLFNQSGFEISRIDFEVGYTAKIVNILTLGLLLNFVPFKYLILSHKKSDGLSNH